MSAVPTDSDIGEPSAYQLRIDIQDFKPPIWRRVVVPSAYTFNDLHELIQVAFEWEDCHLHEFEVDDLRIGDPDTEDDGFSGFLGRPALEDEHQVRVQDLGLKQDKAFTYTYDFGDDWRHKIKVEKILAKDPGPKLPVCLKGRRAAPLEDSGTGTLEEMFDGDPAQFDPEELNARFEMLRRKWANAKTTVPAPAEATGSPEHLFWVVEEDNRCLKCASPMRVGPFDVTLRLRDQGPVLVRFMGRRCGSCNVLHMHLQRLAQSLEETGVFLAEVEGFALGERVVTASLAHKGEGLGPNGFQEVAWEKVTAARDDHDTPPPSKAQLAALPVSKVKWTADTRPVGWIEGEGGSPALTYLTVLVDQDGAIRGFLATPVGPPDEGGLTEFLKKALAKPLPPLEPTRPHWLELGPRFEPARNPVAAGLHGIGIEVETGPALDMDEVFASFDEFMEQPGAPPMLQGKDPTMVIAFLEAGERFLDAQPWRHVEPDVFLGVRLGDEPERPVTIMGHTGEEFGYLVLDSWEDTQGFMADIDAIDARGLHGALPVPTAKPRAAMESASLTDLTYLHPLDGEYLERHGLLDSDESELMIPLRYGPQGPGAPEIPLEDHQRILQALTELLPVDEAGMIRSTTVEGKRVTIRIVEELERLHGARA